MARRHFLFLLSPLEVGPEYCKTSTYTLQQNNHNINAYPEVDSNQQRVLKLSQTERAINTTTRVFTLICSNALYDSKYLQYTR